MTDTILYQGPGYLIGITDKMQTMSHYSDPIGTSRHKNRHPFVDLMAHPEALDSIPELHKSAGLRAMVAVGIESGHWLTTIGCDVHQFFDKDRPAEVAYMVGGYVDYVFRDPSCAADTERYKKLALWGLKGITLPDGQNHCVFELMIEPLKAFYGHSGMYGLEFKSVGIGSSADSAWSSFEAAALAAAFSLSKANPRNAGDPEFLFN